MSEELIRGLISAGVGLLVGIFLTFVWDSLLKLQDKKLEGLKKRLDFNETRVTDLSTQYIEFLECIKQTFKESQELYAKEKADREKQYQANQELTRKNTDEVENS